MWFSTSRERKHRKKATFTGQTAIIISCHLGRSQRMKWTVAARCGKFPVQHTSPAGLSFKLSGTFTVFAGISLWTIPSPNKVPGRLGYSKKTSEVQPQTSVYTSYTGVRRLHRYILILVYRCDVRIDRRRRHDGYFVQYAGSARYAGSTQLTMTKLRRLTAFVRVEDGWMEDGQCRAAISQDAEAEK